MEHRERIVDGNDIRDIDALLLDYEFLYNYGTDLPKPMMFRFGWLYTENRDYPSLFHPENGWEIPEQSNTNFHYLFSKMLSIFLF